MSWISDHPLRTLNSFGIDEPAHRFKEIHEVKELPDLQNLALEGRLQVLGGGSNVLICGPQKGWVIHNRLKGIKEIRTDGEVAEVEAASGEIWDDFVQYALAREWGGAENLSLIPGTVGAAPMQNIGAYGVEVKEIIAGVRAWDWVLGEEVLLSGDQCAFGYRDSQFKRAWKGRYFLSSVIFRLQKKPKIRREYAALDQALTQEGIEDPTIHDISRMVRHIRQTKLPDPARIGNAGSFFKNPILDLDKALTLRQLYPDLPFYPVDAQQVKLPAAWLIEKAGWKGYRQGPCGVHDRQALVLVNYGGARGEEILELSQRIMESVRDLFGLELQREVQVWDASASAKGRRI